MSISVSIPSYDICCVLIEGYTALSGCCPVLGAQGTALLVGVPAGRHHAIGAASGAKALRDASVHLLDSCVGILN